MNPNDIIKLTPAEIDKMPKRQLEGLRDDCAQHCTPASVFYEPLKGPCQWVETALKNLAEKENRDKTAARTDTHHQESIAVAEASTAISRAALTESKEVLIQFVCGLISANKTPAKSESRTPPAISKTPPTNTF